MKTRIISLTGRRPVRIVEEEWPIAAKASDHAFDGKFDFQSNRTWKRVLFVRQGAKSALVYGIFEYDSQWPGEDDISARRGEKVDDDVDIPQALHSVAAELSEFDEGFNWHALAEEAIADLPAEEL